MMKLIIQVKVSLVFFLLLLTFNCFAETLQLSPVEEAWLKEHKTIRISGPQDFPPFQYIDTDGIFKGMASDYIFNIANKVGLKIEVVKNLSWPEILKKIESKEIDVLTCAAISPDREKYLLFAKPNFSFPLIIVSRKDAPFISGLQSLHKRTIAIKPKMSTYEWLKRDRIDFKAYFVNTPLEELQAVSVGHADVAIQNLASATYLIEKNGLANLKIAAPTSYGYYSLAIGVRNDWPELVSIINKGLSSINQEQHNDIRQRWIAVRYEHGISIKDILKWVLTATGIALFVIGLILIWNRRLRAEVILRKKIETALENSKKKYKALFTNAQVALFRTGISDGRLLEINERYAVMAGYPTIEECMAEFNAADAWVDASRRDQLVETLKKTGVVFDYETKIIRKDKVVIWLSFSLVSFD